MVTPLNFDKRYIVSRIWSGYVCSEKMEMRCNMQSSQDGCNTDVTREYEWSCGSTERCTFTVARISSSDESIIPASIHILWHQIVNMEHGDVIDEQVCRGVGWERTWQINEKNTPRINWMPLTFLTTCQSFVDKTNLFSKQRVKRHPPQKKIELNFFSLFLSSISWSRWSVLNESRSIKLSKAVSQSETGVQLEPIIYSQADNLCPTYYSAITWWSRGCAGQGVRQASQISKSSFSRPSAWWRLWQMKLWVFESVIG